MPDISVKLIKASSSSTDEYEDSAPLCKSVVKRINPNELVKERGYDVYESSSFSQIIEVEECEKPGTPCTYSYPFKKTACIQRKMKIQLKVSTKNKGHKFEDFEIPSVCECAFFSRI